MNKLQVVFLLSLGLLAAVPSAHAAKANKVSKPGQPTKESLVLMPLRVAEDDKGLTGAMEAALVQGLQQKFEVFSGEQVAQKAREIFMKESRNTAKKECDENRCMQGIAEAFQAELIATANVTKQADGYFLALSIQNIFVNKVEYSRSLPCEHCDSYQVVDKLKELGGAPEVAAPVVEAKAKLKAIREQEAQGPAMVEIPGKHIALGKYLVTRGEFAKFVRETGYDGRNSCWTIEGGEPEDRSGRNWRNPGFSQDDTHPVTCVSWDDAQAYVQWLSRKTGRKYRLPTEPEWEAACYAGSQTEYCGGNDINAVAWYNDNSGNTTHPVGQKQANGYGLYDMSGNAWEWMENKYDSEHNWRALRGGSWGDIPQNVRAAHRVNLAPAERDSGVGFRLARTLL